MKFLINTSENHWKLCSSWSVDKYTDILFYLGDLLSVGWMEYVIGMQKLTLKNNK